MNRGVCVPVFCVAWCEKGGMCRVMMFEVLYCVVILCKGFLVAVVWREKGGLCDLMVVVVVAMVV